MQRDSGAPLYEFFAGGGLARLGLEPDFACVFANDIDPAKAQAYRSAFGDADMREGDIWSLTPADLPGQAALVSRATYRRPLGLSHRTVWSRHLREPLQFISILADFELDLLDVPIVTAE